MTIKFTNTTQRGQITLPAAWRKQFDTNNFTIEILPEKLEIKPVYTDQNIFDAQSDNEGNTVEINEFIDALELSLK